MYNPIRDGCRGGHDLFKWDDVRLMPYKDRECYLGASLRLGYLDKGGKWRRKDWWQNYAPVLDGHNLLQEKDKKVAEEREEIRKKEMQSYMMKLGMVKAPDNKLQEPPAKPQSMISALEANEISTKKFEDGGITSKVDRVAGLGFVKYISECMPIGRLRCMAPVPSMTNPLTPPSLGTVFNSSDRLEGVGVGDLRSSKVQGSSTKTQAEPHRKRSRSREKPKHESQYSHHRRHKHHGHNAD